MLDAQTITTNLPYFSGTEQYHRWSILYPKFVLTDGAKYVADNAEAYWLMDIIASHQRNPKVRAEYFQVWTLRVHPDKRFMVICDDGNKHVLATQSSDYTDFPLPEGIKLYAIYSGDMLVILLPGEY